VLEAVSAPLSAPPPEYVSKIIRWFDGSYKEKQLKVCTPTSLTPHLNPTLITDGAGLDKLVPFFERQKIIGLDIETNVVDGFVDRRVRTIQVGDKNEQYCIDLLAFADGNSEHLVGWQGHKGTQAQKFAPVLNVIRPILESNEWLKVGANLEFEFVNLFWCLGLRPWHFFDVQIAEKNIHMGEVGFYLKGFWALDDLVARYCGLHLDKTLQTSFDLSTPLTPEQVAYSVFDVRLPLAVRLGQLPKIEKEGIAGGVQIDNNAIPAFAEMHVNGIFLDAEPFTKLLDDTRAEHALNVLRLDPYFIPAVGLKGIQPWEREKLDTLEKAWRTEKDKVKRAENKKAFEKARRDLKDSKEKPEKCEGEANINYDSPAQLLDCLRGMGYGVKVLKSSDDDHLKKLASADKVVETLKANGWKYDLLPDDLDKLKGDPLIDAIREYRETKKVLKTYDAWVEEHINPVTGRIHSRISPLGAETNRTSSVNPNIQNILKGKDWRGCFKARPGYVMMSCDWAGQELRIITELSRYKKWADAFAKDWDVHSIGAEEMEGEKWKAATLPDCKFLAFKLKCDCKQHKMLREPAKNINFGIAYGMTEYKLSNDLGIPVSEAREKLKRWHAANEPVSTTLTKLGHYAKENREARTLGGHRRKFQKLTWEQATAKAYKKLKDAGTDRHPTNQEIGKILIIHEGSIEREGKNTPVQGTGAEMMKVVMGCGYDKNGKPFLFHLLRQYQAEIVNSVHDELVLECPEQYAELVKAIVMDAMERAGAEFVTIARMVAEGKISDRWKKD
jgi:hypothetical protein